jgi:hypothetical protein
LVSGTSQNSDFLKSREFKSSKSRNPELYRPSGNPLEDLDEDASNISMMSVTTNLNEQPVNVNFTEQLEQNVKQLQNFALDISN